jgi:enoyl-CoA hydratase/carnithine racemase
VPIIADSWDLVTPLMRPLSLVSRRTFVRTSALTAMALAARIEEENAIFAAQLRSAEAREAFAAFREKRPADFSRVR